MIEVGSTVRSRVPYEPIHKRKELHLPDDGKIILWVIVNIENWLPQRAMPRTILPPPMGKPQLPDIPNWAWHEYGMRVGYWRFLNALNSRKIRATLAINGTALDIYPEACAAALEAQWEFIGHGYTQRPMHFVENESDEIKKTIAAIKKFTGQAPKGWESPGLTETDDTADYLADAGIEYVANWVLDEQPVPVNTKSGSLTALPYPVEINDVVISAVEKHSSDEIWKRGRDQFDRLYQESKNSTRVMSISLHPFLTGVPHRIQYLEKLLDYILGHPGVVPMTGSEILGWYLNQIDE